jgi:hypothetical protein
MVRSITSFSIISCLALHAYLKQRSSRIPRERHSAGFIIYFFGHRSTGKKTGVISIAVRGAATALYDGLIEKNPRKGEMRGCLMRPLLLLDWSSFRTTDGKDFRVDNRMSFWLPH